MNLAPPKLALISPLPPDKTGVADFTARLAAKLSERWDVELRRGANPEALRRADARLYQIGNNALHAGAYEAALAIPGVVELHDAVLHHFLLGRLTREQYLDEFALNYGEWARQEGDRLWQRRGQASTDEAFFQRPLLRRIVEAAQAVIVHNPAARAAVESVSKETTIVQIPHFAEAVPEPTEAERRGARRQLGVDPDDLLISCFGFQRPTKRLRSVFRAAAQLPTPHRVLIAGEFVSANYEATLEPWLSQSTTIRRPYAPETEFRSFAAATDVCVNLRSPSAGESSGIAMRLMALGRPVILTHGAETSGFPESTVVKVDPGEAEEAMLAASLELLAAQPELRRAIGAAGRAHLLEHHALDQIIKLYSGTLSDSARRAGAEPSKHRV